MVLNAKMVIGERFKLARKHAKLSQEELALAVGCTQGLISKIERGDQDATGLIVKIAEACGVSAKWLALGQGEMLDETKYPRYKANEPQKINQTFSEHNFITIEGKEINPNEYNLIQMYMKLSIESQEMVDYLTNKLYAIEHPNDKIAAPFKKTHQKKSKG